MTQHVRYTFSNISVPSSTRGNVPVKLKLQHPPPPPPPSGKPRHLTVTLVWGGENLNVDLKGWGI